VSAGAEPRRLGGGAYKLELRQALERERYAGDLVDWSGAEFEREGDAVRVTGAKKDALQEVITLMRKSVTDVPLQFKNFRD